MDGGHSLEQTCAKTEEVLRAVFDELHLQRVALEGMILKPNMILPGSDSVIQVTEEEVAEVTVNSLLRVVPAAIPAIAFLSGGQPAALATAHLNAMNVRFKSSNSQPPWALAFSFARAIQQPALELWRGEDNNTFIAQQALLHRAKCNQAARRGEYTQAMETP
jgi:fructose-bisphosphate aldolase class I